MSRQVIQPIGGSSRPVVRPFRNASSVRSVSRRRNGRVRVQLADGRKLILHDQASVGIGDFVRVIGSHVEVLCINGTAEVDPPYSAISRLNIAAETKLIHVKEPTTQKERDDIAFLRSLHYRKGLPFGRRACLIAKTRWEGGSQVLGFVELSFAPLLNAARDRVLDAPFDSENISWRSWDYRTRNKYAKTIVEISRIVVHPQFRNFRISQILLKHAFDYARSHWQLCGVKPLFVEIVAEMLRLCPFVSSAGMTFVGDTQGNLDRLYTDLRYYFKKKKFHHASVQFEPSFVRMQVHYLRKALELMEKRKISDVNDLIRYLKRYSQNPDTMSSPIVSKILRYPRPTYMMGLDTQSNAFVHNRVEQLRVSRPDTRSESLITPHSEPIRVCNLAITLESPIRWSGTSGLVARAFGIGERTMSVPVLRALNLTVNPGDIVLVIGPSGAGKTTFVNCLTGAIRPSSGKIVMPRDARVGMLTPIRSRGPVIEALGLTAVDSIRILSNCGINDVHCYLGSFCQLSAGEKYRVMLARLLASKCNVWVADDFLCNLDPTTANAVAQGIRKVVKTTGATLIASTSRYDAVEALAPDIVLHKPFGPKHEVVTRQAFLRSSYPLCDPGGACASPEFPRDISNERLLPS